MRIVVTGGGGYLGSALVSLLLDAGHQVRVFDRFCFGEDALTPWAQTPGCEIVRGDIRRLQETPGLLQDVDAVVHLASLSNDPSCDLDEEMAHDVNVESTRELASQAVQHGVRRFIFGSTCLVYGKGVFEVLDEQSPANPVSTFGATKLEAEHLLLDMANSNFEPVIARNATLFGWAPRMRFDLAINQMVATALHQKRIVVRGGGNQWRPFVHVADAAQALRMLAEAPAAKVQREIFNVGSDVGNYQIIALARRVARHFEGIEIEVPRDDDDLRSYRVQFAKIRELGFRCQYSVDEGITEVRDKLVETGIDPFTEAHLNVQRMKTLLATPVAEGGEPVAPRFIPLARPGIGPEEEHAVLTTLRSGWITSGPQIPTFEKMFSDTVSAPYTVAVNSCTAALHLCLVHLGVQPGDEVITSSLTWGSTGNTILNMGAKVVFADIDPGTLNIDPAAIEAAITDRTRVIMPVHVAGQPCRLDEIYAIARRHGIAVVEDAAHALGAAYKGVPIGNYGDFACFSFYAIKNITTMEGGTITLRDADAAHRLRRLASNGISVTAWQRYGRSAVPSPPEVVEPGYKYLMSNVGAAMGIEQLKKFPQFKAARKRLAHLYATALAEVDEIAIPEVIDDIDHAWHLFIIRFRADKLTRTRDELAHALRQENIGTGFHFYGLHLNQYYREVLGMRPEDLPNATAASHEVLSLPLFPAMTDKNVHEVVEAVKKVVAHARK